MKVRPIPISCRPGFYEASSFRVRIHIIQHLQRCNVFVSATPAHTTLLKAGLLNETFTANHLSNCYLRLQRTDCARKLFDEMPAPNVVSYSSLMAGYVDMGRPQTALAVFREMFKSPVMPNEFTLATVINACSVLADLGNGKKTHAHVEILGFTRNLVVCSSLVDMYGKCNDVDSARRVFDSMDCRNIVSWTSMITAYAQNARGHEALEVFREFSRLMPDHRNKFLLGSVINACASLGDLSAGKVSHGAAVRRDHDSNDVVVTALIDMYAKCGCITYSFKLFRRMANPCVIPYTSVIVAAGKNGLGKLSIELFEEMISRGIKPNAVTFVGVLHACSHSGLVDEGLQLLDSMRIKHGIVPDGRHYACIVDMLGRTGRLDDAYHLAKAISVDLGEDALLWLWGSLLSASRLHERVDIALDTSKRLIESNLPFKGTHATLSNAYASVGEWDAAYSIRSEMKRTGVYKEPGCSWLRIRIPHSGSILGTII